CIATSFVVLGIQALAQEQTPRFREAVKVPGQTVTATPNDYAVTFSGPFSLPGVSLPGGTYLFRSPAANIVQVLSGDRTHTYVMVSTIPARRAKSNSPDIMLGQAQRNAPKR